MVQMSEDQAKEKWSKITAHAWEDPSFKQQLLSNPKPVLKQEGFTYPDNVSIKIVEEGSREAQETGRFSLTEDASGNYNLVMQLAQRPPDVGAELSESELESVAGGWSISCCCCSPCCCCT